MVENRVDQ
jgi:flagellar biosynthesis chaperone FliJ